MPGGQGADSSPGGGMTQQNMLAESELGAYVNSSQTQNRNQRRVMNSSQAPQHMGQILPNASNENQVGDQRGQQLPHFN